MNWEYYFNTIAKCYNCELTGSIKNNIKYNCNELNIFTDKENMYNEIYQMNCTYYYSKYYYRK